jgi:apolipoprotein N-acyltransferase
MTASRSLSIPLIVSVLIGIACLTFAFAPMGQFYLAWIGLAPWLVMVGRCKSSQSALWRGWIFGTLFFAANLWWLAPVTLPGMIALEIYCGLFWGAAALLIRGADLLGRGVRGVFAIAMVWTAGEWIRGNLMTGFPWLYLGHSQTPILFMCQIADFGGAYAVTFWVVAVNALLAIFWLNRSRKMVSSIALVAVLLIFCAGYGFYRLHQTPGMISPGPVVAVIQSNDPQSNSGEKSSSIPDRLKFHIAQSEDAIAQTPGTIDLLVWSETMFPDLNRQAREILQQVSADQPELRQPLAAFDAIGDFARLHHIPVLTGGLYEAGWQDQDGYMVATDRRNSTFLFDSAGRMDDSPGRRYDKIHLVPFGEIIPFQHSIPWLYRLFIQLGPKYYADYVLQSGDSAALTVFQIAAGGQPVRFVTPICFEDADPELCARMFRPRPGEMDRGKRADFIVNVTNDGWFLGTQNAEHLQSAIFRCIENRVPAARSVNTGISGFIDSAGRTSHLLPPRTSGWQATQLMLDRRVTFYTLQGDFFAEACAIAAGLFAIAALSRGKSSRRKPPGPTLAK